MNEEQKELNRIGSIALRKKAKRHDYFSAVWITKDGKHNRTYKIVSRRNNFVYAAWSPYVASTMSSRLSEKYTVGEFVKQFELYVK